MRKKQNRSLALIIIISIIVSVYLANKITRPIREITKSAKKLGERNYNIIFYTFFHILYNIC